MCNTELYIPNTTNIFSLTNCSLFITSLQRMQFIYLFKYFFYVNILLINVCLSNCTPLYRMIDTQTLYFTFHCIFHICWLLYYHRYMSLYIDNQHILTKDHPGSIKFWVAVQRFSYTFLEFRFPYHVTRWIQGLFMFEEHSLRKTKFKESVTESYMRFLSTAP